MTGRNVFNLSLYKQMRNMADAEAAEMDRDLGCPGHAGSTAIETITLEVHQIIDAVNRAQLALGRDRTNETLINDIKAIDQLSGDYAKLTLDAFVAQVQVGSPYRRWQLVEHADLETGAVHPRFLERVADEKKAFLENFGDFLEREQVLCVLLLASKMAREYRHAYDQLIAYLNDFLTDPITSSSQSLGQHIDVP